MDNQFRSVAFGGFNRHDVMEYLERTAGEYAQSLQNLQGQLFKTEQERDELAARLDEAQAEMEETAEQAAESAQALEQERQARKKAEEQVQALQSRADTLEAERQRLQEEADRLRPDAEAYAAVKERSAGIELDAHRRAQGVLDQADEQARQLRGQMDQWLSRVRREYDQLCSQVDATVAHAAGELEKVRSSLERITDGLESQAGAMDTLVEAYNATDPQRVPAPVPLDEEEN